MTVYLLVWHWHRTRARFTVLVSCNDEIVVSSCPLLCLQRQVAKLARQWFPNLFEPLPKSRWRVFLNTSIFCSARS